MVSDRVMPFSLKKLLSIFARFILTLSASTLPVSNAVNLSSGLGVPASNDATGPPPLLAPPIVVNTSVINLTS